MNKVVFVIGPHTDDIEFHIGGTVNSICNKHEVYYMTFSFAEKSLPEGFDGNATHLESKNAALTLGIREENIIQFDFPVRRFPEFRQDILECLVDLRKTLHPNIILCPSIYEVHQDHNTLANECIRAFKDTCSIYEYESIRNDFISFSPRILMPLSIENITTKIRALECYKSQIVKYPNYKDRVISLAKTRGNMINHSYAEAFDIHRMIASEVL